MRSINARAIRFAAFAAVLFVQYSLPLAAQPADHPYRRAKPAATGVPRPEDLVRLPGSDWVVASSMRGPNGEPGSLFLANAPGASAPRVLYPSDLSRNEPNHERFPQCSSPPDLREFYPHGLSVARKEHDAVELYAVNHGGREAIEIFEVSLGRPFPRATWIGCVPLPNHAFGNGVALLPGGGIVVSNMYDTSDSDFLRKFALAQPTGGVLQWTPGNGWSDAVSQRLSGANGIEVAPNGSWLYVSEWAARKVWAFPLKAKAAPKIANLNFLPDNLRWTERGTLLVAGQNASPERLFGCQARQEPCPLGFTVAELDPATLSVRVLVKGGDAAFGGATGALFVGRDLWVGSFRGNTIGKFIPLAGKAAQ